MVLSRHEVPLRFEVMRRQNLSSPETFRSSSTEHGIANSGMMSIQGSAIQNRQMSDNGCEKCSGGLSSLRIVIVYTTPEGSSSKLKLTHNRCYGCQNLSTLTQLTIDKRSEQHLGNLNGHYR